MVCDSKSWIMKEKNASNYKPYKLRMEKVAREEISFQMK